MEWHSIAKHDYHCTIYYCVLCTEWRVPGDALVSRVSECASEGVMPGSQVARARKCWRLRRLAHILETPQIRAVVHLLAEIPLFPGPPRIYYIESWSRNCIFPHHSPQRTSHKYALSTASNCKITHTLLSMPTYVFEKRDILNSHVRLDSESRPIVFTTSTTQSLLRRNVTTLFDANQNHVASIRWKEKEFELQGKYKDTDMIKKMPQSLCGGRHVVILTR